MKLTLDHLQCSRCGRSYLAPGTVDPGCPTCPPIRTEVLPGQLKLLDVGDRTRVVNLRRESFDVYIGRGGHGQDGYFGNPFRLNAEASSEVRAEALSKFRTYFDERIRIDAEFRRRVEGLRGKRLGCFCKPKPCHGDVYVEHLDSKIAPGG